MKTFYSLNFSPIVLAAILLAGCGSKGPNEAEVKASEDTQLTTASNQKYQEYAAQISEARFAGMKIEKLKIFDKTYDYVVSSSLADNRSYIDQLSLTIRNDSSLSGTETTGSKGKLLVELNSPQNADFLGTIKQVNYPLIQATYNCLAAFGSDGLKETGVTASVIKIAGADNYLKLIGDRENYSQNLTNIFVPLGARTDGGNIR